MINLCAERVEGAADAQYFLAFERRIRALVYLECIGQLVEGTRPIAVVRCVDVDIAVEIEIAL